MKSLDHRLRRLVQKAQQDAFDPLAEGVAVLMSVEGSEGTPLVEVLVRCSDPAVGARLQEAGMVIWAQTEGAYTVVTGVAPLETLAALSEMEGVEHFEASRPLAGELDLSRVDSRVEPLHIVDPGAPTVRGEGVIVGIIDTGIDYRHPKFRHSDGSSRILFLWDQQVSGQHPDIPFGRQYTKAELDTALASEEPLDAVPHRDRNGHGTHVAGIAASNGRGGLRFRGLAPDADLIIVAPRSDGETLGRSASSLAAYQYIVDRAAGRPLAINQSQGMNGKPCHSSRPMTTIRFLSQSPGMRSASNSIAMPMKPATPRPPWRSPRTWGASSVLENGVSNCGVIRSVEDASISG